MTSARTHGPITVLEENWGTGQRTTRDRVVSFPISPTIMFSVIRRHSESTASVALITNEQNTLGKIIEDLKNQLRIKIKLKHDDP